MILYAWKTIHGAILVWDKKVIKTELEAIIEPLFRDFESKDNFELQSIVIGPKQNIKAEISQIVRVTAEKLGPNIFKARVESVFGNKFSREIQDILSAPKA